MTLKVECKKLELMNRNWQVDDFSKFIKGKHGFYNEGKTEKFEIPFLARKIGQYWSRVHRKMQNRKIWGGMFPKKSWFCQYFHEIIMTPPPLGNFILNWKSGIENIVLFMDIRVFIFGRLIKSQACRTFFLPPPLFAVEWASVSGVQGVWTGARWRLQGVRIEARFGSEAGLDAGQGTEMATLSRAHHRSWGFTRSRTGGVSVVLLVGGKLVLRPVPRHVVVILGVGDDQAGPRLLVLVAVPRLGEVVSSFVRVWEAVRIVCRETGSSRHCVGHHPTAWSPLPDPV